MDKHRETVEKVINDLTVNRSSPVISNEKYDQVVAHLKDKSIKVNSHFKAWVKSKQFQLVDVPGIGQQDALLIPNKKGIDTNDGTKPTLRVMRPHQIFDIVDKTHKQDCKHGGVKKMEDMIHKQYYGITRVVIEKYCSTCSVCQEAQPQITRPHLKPIIENAFMDRLQIDLIDMRHRKDGDWTYIANCMDHFTKFHVVFPLKTKSAEELAAGVKRYFLAYFGPPRILHTDNGREFCNQVLRALLKSWSNDLKFVNGRPRHSQSQGLIERGNRYIQDIIGKWKREQDLEHVPWADWLPDIQYTMNTTRTETLKDTPYHVTFCQQPRIADFADYYPDIMNEEDLEVNTSRPVPAPRLVKPVPPPRKIVKVSSDIVSEEPVPCISSDNVSEEPVPCLSSDNVSEEPVPCLSSDIVSEKPVLCESISRDVVKKPPVPAPRKVAPPTISSDNDIVSDLLNLENNVDESDSKELDNLIDLVDEDIQHLDNPLVACRDPINIRKRARDNTYNSADQMIRQFAKRKRVVTHDFNAGENVTVCIPKIDRNSTDLPRVPGKVMSVHGEFYKIGTAQGIIKKKFHGGDMQSYVNDVEVNTTKEISLRECSMSFNSVNSFIKTLCKCTGGCKTKAFPCRRQGVKCTSHCHQSSNCRNKEEILQGSTFIKEYEIKIIDNGEWLTDNHFTATNMLLKKQFREIDGLEDTILQQKNQWNHPTSTYIQFFHVNNNHWIATCNLGEEDDKTVLIYDSQRQKPTVKTRNMIAQYVRSSNDELTFSVMNVEGQDNGNDCGVFAISFAASLLFGDDPTQLKYIDNRRHLSKCLSSGKFTSFPSVFFSRKPRVLSSITDQIHCICKGIDNGKTMYRCKKCNVWYHQQCVGTVPSKLVKQWSCNYC